MMTTGAGSRGESMASARAFAFASPSPHVAEALIHPGQLSPSPGATSDSFPASEGNRLVGVGVADDDGTRRRVSVDEWMYASRLSAQQQRPPGTDLGVVGGGANSGEAPGAWLRESLPPRNIPLSRTASAGNNSIRSGSEPLVSTLTGATPATIPGVTPGHNSDPPLTSRSSGGDAGAGGLYVAPLPQSVEGNVVPAAILPIGTSPPPPALPAAGRGQGKKASTGIRSSAAGASSLSSPSTTMASKGGGAQQAQQAARHRSCMFCREDHSKCDGTWRCCEHNTATHDREQCIRHGSESGNNPN